MNDQRQPGDQISQKHCYQGEVGTMVALRPLYQPLPAESIFYTVKSKIQYIYRHRVERIIHFISFEVFTIYRVVFFSMLSTQALLNSFCASKPGQSMLLSLSFDSRFQALLVVFFAGWVPSVLLEYRIIELDFGLAASLSSSFEGII